MPHAVHARQRTLDAALAALVGAVGEPTGARRRSRLRAVLLTGVAGSGKSHLADALVERLRGLGHEVALVDDAHELDRATLADLVETSIAAHARGTLAAVVLTASGDAASLRRMLERHLDCIELALEPLDEDGVRSVLAEHGVAPWNVRAAHAMRSARGNPRRALDAVFGAIATEPVDALGAMLAPWPLLRDATDAMFRGDDASMRLIAASSARRWREQRDAEAGAVLLDALEEGGPARTAALEALGGGDVDATQLAADVAAIAQRAGDRALVVHAAVASARARVRAGDDVLLAALATLADEAAVIGRVDLAVNGWCTVALARSRREEHGAANAAIERALSLGDTAGLVRHGLRARLACARVAAAAGRSTIARELLDDVIEHAGARRLDGIVLAAAPDLVRAQPFAAGGGASGDGAVATEAVLPTGRLRGVLASEHVASAGSRARNPSRRLQLAVTLALGQQGQGDRAGVRGTLVAAVEDQLRTSLGSCPTPAVLAQAARLLAWSGAPSSDLRPLLLLVDAAHAPQHRTDATDAELRAARAELRGWRARAIGDLASADEQLARARCEWRLAGMPEQAAACAALERSLDGAVGPA